MGLDLNCVFYSIQVSIDCPPRRTAVAQSSMSGSNCFRDFRKRSSVLGKAGECAILVARMCGAVQPACLFASVRCNPWPLRKLSLSDECSSQYLKCFEGTIWHVTNQMRNIYINQKSVEWILIFIYGGLCLGIRFKCWSVWSESRILAKALPE
jgi:hypothetical protein